jgi:hypothetical protein
VAHQCRLEHIDQPVANGAATLLTEAPSYTNNLATVSTQLVKPLPTGGLAGITFRTDYELTTQNAAVNPAYQPRLGFVFEQPLLQG